MVLRRRKVDPARAEQIVDELVPAPAEPPPRDPREWQGSRSVEVHEEQAVVKEGDVIWLDGQKARVVSYESSTATSSPTTPTSGWRPVVESVLTVDPASTFERLRDELSLGPEDSRQYASVALALDAADRRYFEAVLLARAAKLEELAVDRRVEEDMEVLRTTSRVEIEKEKRAAAEAAGSKAVGRATKDEIQDRLVANWPDKVRSLERRRDEQHAARAVAEELMTAWRSRAASLRELIAGLRASSGR